MLKAASRTTALLIVAFTLSCVVFAHAQSGNGDSGFFIESIAQESVVPGGVDSLSSGLLSNVNEYDINLDLPSGLALFRNFKRSEMTAKDLIFNTAISEESVTGATLMLGSRTSMSFSRNESVISDVFQQLQGSENTTVMSLSQGFGSGSSSGKFTIARSLQNEGKAGDVDLSTLTQSLGIATGLGSGMQFSGSYFTTESQESAFRLQEQGYNAELKMALSGGEGRAHFDYLQRLVEGRSTDRRQIDLVAPFAVQGGTLMAEHHLDQTITDNNEKTDRETSFVVPLGMLMDGAQASYHEVLKVRGDNREEKTVLNFMTPFRMFGHDASFEHSQTELFKNEKVKEERVMRLAADFGGSKGIIERMEMVESRGEDLEHRARLRMQTPGIGLTDWASFSASQVREELEGKEISRVSRVDLAVEPFKPLEVHAIYTRHEEPGQQTRVDHDIKTALSLSDSAMLKGAIQEMDKTDGSPAIVRNLELTKKAGDAVDLRVGYSSFGAQYEENDGEILAQLNWDAGSGLGFSAFYAEFDDKKNKPLDEPSTTLEFWAGDPSELSFRAGYSDHGKRDEPERSLGFVTDVFGGGLKLDYIRNPLDPRGKVVMLSDVYELAFKRQVMGGVSMDLGYRYFVPRAGELLDDDHFFKFQLDGGDVNNGGQIALKYLSGHFVPYPGRADPPASILDLSYEKRWPADAGRLTLSLAREEAPELSVGIDDNFEAEVKYETIF